MTSARYYPVLRQEPVGAQLAGQKGFARVADIKVSSCGGSILSEPKEPLRGGILSWPMTAVGQTLQVAFGDAAGQVRNDPKADLIPRP